MRNLILGLLVLGGSFHLVNAQDLQNGVVVNDYTSLLTHHEQEAAKLITNDAIELSSADARGLLDAMKGSKAQVKRLKVQRKVLPDVELARKLKLATVIFGIAFDCGSCEETHIDAASGYVIDASGVVVTNYHVVKSFTSFARKNLGMTIQTAEGKVYAVTDILASNEHDDLCILRVDTKGDELTPLPIGSGADQGDAVYVMGHPFGHFYYFSKGIVARNFYDYVNEKKDVKRPIMEITADYAGGSSGGPIIDARGNLAATVSSTKSIYYSPVEQKNLQMVIKTTKPASCLLEMIDFN